MNELDSIQNIKIDSVIQTINEINQHTNIWGGPIPTLITLLSIAASIITIIGLINLIRAIKERSIDNNCRKKILLDLCRHIFTINTYNEAIRYNLKSGKVLKEGILERFCFIDSDLELQNLRFSDISYEKLHSMQEKMRNFNSVALIAEKHFTNPDCPENILIEDLNDMWDRSYELSNDIIKYSQNAKINLTEKEISTYIRKYYSSDDRIPKWKKEGKLDPSIHPIKRNSYSRNYYDNKIFDLSDIMDDCIRHRITKVRFNDSWEKKSISPPPKKSKTLETSFPPQKNKKASTSK